ncbi:GNAT family N-acetyltransferase [Halobaculum sp. WSA2]|uniref:GNAT family N-acetyltransferase n=1 Tax=Halobaculum saliterrae TaxID=2073113 RepID=A0A6B0SWU5_9EURY|nr:GNAT family N-acetyltransferase [Halobaculum saliterrae]MXR40420.1 GNAT family N-acetyltransferase [Halobaculum saliterrae]
MSVRDAKPVDAEAVRTVHYASIIGLGPEAYDQRQVKAWASGCAVADYTAAIGDDGLDYVVADHDGVVVGFGSLKWEVPDDYEADVDAEVTAVYVLPSIARRGIGTELYTELERRAREQNVEVLGLSASLPAVSFYEAHGYDRVTEYNHEFSSHEDTNVTGRVVEMKKEL